MVEISRTDLALLGLLYLEEDGIEGPSSLSTVADTLDVQTDNLSQQMRLAGALHDLWERGMIEVPDVESTPTYELTPAGRERANKRRQQVADVEIDIVDEKRHRLTVGEATAKYELPSGRILANLTDGVFYRTGTVEPSLRGREMERNVCRKIFERVETTGRGETLFITGPGGIGKTALTTTVLESFDDETTVLQTRCRGRENAPYHPIRDLLDQLGASMPSQPPVGSTIKNPDEFDSRTAAQFLGFTKQLLPAADEPMRVLFLDDLHLADPATLRYLASLGSELAEYRCCVVACYRPDQFEPPSPFEETFTETSELVTFVRLNALERPATRGVVEQVLETREIPNEFIDRIHELTGGNPLFIEETLSTLQERDELSTAHAVYPEDLAVLDLPEAIEAVIEAHLEALPPDARALLKMAALVGNPVPQAVLEDVVALSALDTETVVDMAVEAGIFERVTPTTLSFRSEVVRDAIRARTDTDPDLHATIATALESAVSDADTANSEVGRLWAGTIARHHDRARNEAVAIEWYCRAGKQHMAVYAHDTAIDHYLTALELARDLDDEATIVSVNEQLARIWLVTAEFDRAHRHIEYALDQTTSSARQQALYALATQVHIHRGDYDEAIEAATLGLQLDGAAVEAECRLLLGQASAEENLGDYKLAVETAERARKLATESGEQSLVMEAEYLIGERYVKQDRVDDAQAHLQESLSIANDLADKRFVAQITMVLGIAANKTGAIDSYREYNEQALEAFEAVGDPHGAALARSNLAVADRKDGAYDRARERLLTAIETLDALGDVHSAARQRGNLGSLALSRGEYAVAQEHYQDALESFEAIGERRDSATARLYLGNICLKRQEYDQAQVYLEDALDAFEEMDIRRGIAAGKLDLGVIEVTRGNETESHTLLTESLDTAVAIGAKPVEFRVHQALAYYDTVFESAAKGLERWEEIGGLFQHHDQSYSIEPFQRIIDACVAEDAVEIAIEWSDRGLSSCESLEGSDQSRLRDYLGETRRTLDSSVADQG